MVWYTFQMQRCEESVYEQFLLPTLPIQCAAYYQLQVRKRIWCNENTWKEERWYWRYTLVKNFNISILAVRILYLVPETKILKACWACWTAYTWVLVQFCTSLTNIVWKGIHWNNFKVFVSLIWPRLTLLELLLPFKNFFLHFQFLIEKE